MAMSESALLDSDEANIASRLHVNIAQLIDGNHVQGVEVVHAGHRACPCRLVYSVDWAFSAQTSSQRIAGNRAVSTHFGFNQQQYDTETEHRCNVGRTHKPIRETFISSILEQGGTSLGDACQSVRIWDFGQHSVHEKCNTCDGTQKVSCSPCYGRGKKTCYRCHGRGSTTETRYLQGRSETYQQNCYECGCSGQTTCYTCNGSGTVQCSPCQGHGFFTDIMSVTVQATPQVHITSQSTLSATALSDYLTRFPVSRIIQYLDFTLLEHGDAAANVWRIRYEAHTTVAELDIHLRKKTYMAAAIGHKALAFVRPAIFDDIFIEELNDLRTIWSGKKKTFSNARARDFFTTYAGQPVLDAALKSVSKLQGSNRKTPGNEVIHACDGYISPKCADLLGHCMAMLLDKISPPHSLWSWIAVMAIPLLLLFLGAQNWLERHTFNNYFDWALVWLSVAIIAALAMLAVSPLAVTLSSIVSAIRRRAVPKEYRQHGRNWQPLKPLLRTAVVVATCGAGLGILSHQQYLPHWDNKPLSTIETTLNLLQLEPYNKVMHPIKSAGFLVSPPTFTNSLSRTELDVRDIQSNLIKLGYRLAVTGQVDKATQKAIAAYAKKRNLRSSEPSILQASLCQDLQGACAGAKAFSP